METDFYPQTAAEMDRLKDELAECRKESDMQANENRGLRHALQVASQSIAELNREIDKLKHATPGNWRQRP